MAILIIDVRMSHASSLTMEYDIKTGPMIKSMEVAGFSTIVYGFVSAYDQYFHSVPNLLSTGNT